MIYIFLAPGFEEIEALATVDVLRRSGLAVTLAAVGKDRYVKGAHNMEVAAEVHVDDVAPSKDDALVLPGGMPGALNLLQCHRLCDLLKQHAAEGGLIAAICAAPMIPGELGLLVGRKATCYPGFEDKLRGAAYTPAMVVEDGNYITGRGPAAAIDFACAIAARYVSPQEVAAVRQGMLFE